MLRTWKARVGAGDAEHDAAVDALVALHGPMLRVRVAHIPQQGPEAALASRRTSGAMNRNACDSDDHVHHKRGIQLGLVLVARLTSVQGTPSSARGRQLLKKQKLFVFAPGGLHSSSLLQLLGKQKPMQFPEAHWLFCDTSNVVTLIASFVQTRSHWFRQTSREEICRMFGSWYMGEAKLLNRARSEAVGEPGRL